MDRLFYRNEKDGRFKVAIFPSPEARRQSSRRWRSRLVYSPLVADGRALTYVVTRQGVSNIWSKPIHGGPAAN